MDLRQLEQFVEVVRTGGFARAAKALHLSQPSLTRNIAALERNLGVELFLRTPKGAVLTEAGHRLLPHAAAVLEELDRAHAEFAEGRTTEVGQVRIGVSPNFLFDVLPEALAGLAANPDGPRVVVATGTYEQLTEALRNHEHDLVLCLIPDTTPQMGHRDVALQPLGQELAVPVVRRDHPVLRSGATLEHLTGIEWAVPHQLSLSYRFESAFFRKGLQIPVQRLNATSMPLMRRAILEWGLAGMLPLAYARPDLEAGRLARLDVAELEMAFTVGLLMTQSALRDGATALAVDAIRQASRQLFDS